MEPDADILTPGITVNEEPVFVYAGNAAFIDLTAKVRANQPVRLIVTRSPKLGVLTDLGEGLLQYTPPQAAEKRQDAFEFTVFSHNDEVIRIDTVSISIGKDSTDLPCGIFPADDFVYGVGKNMPAVIPVLANDYICDTDSADLEVSVFGAADAFPPFFGEAHVEGQSIVYTAGDGFLTEDKIIYKVTVKSDPGKAAYGVVHVVAQIACDFVPKPDVFAFSIDTLKSQVIQLPVLMNDSLCSTLVPLTLRVGEAPMYGVASVSANGLSYDLSDTTAITSGFRDHLSYELCDGSYCKTAIAEIRVKTESSSCQIIVRSDTFDLSGNQIPLIYLGVLSNDEVCDGYTSFEITEPPHHGTAFVSDTMKSIGYQRDTFQNKNDSLEYMICRAQACGHAKVYIQRE